jgi:NAD(P)H-hydrate repair Nnr-like enzyme with NAD(P)H-hydrate dehydratase domain
MARFTAFTPDDAADHIAVPGEHDDKYSRGVLGVITGSTTYPGAAVLSVEAALHTGVGMVRYLGAARPSELVLARRPEAVTAPGRVQAWLIGSGMDATDRDEIAIIAALEQGVPAILDGGALDLYPSATAPVVLTPHYRELARLLGVDAAEVAADPARWARIAADTLGVTVLLKGHTTWICGDDIDLSVGGAPTWLATAGAGDALAGILGALVATHAAEVSTDPAALAKLAATAAVIHSLAATRASAGGPVTILGLCAAIPPTVAAVLARGDRSR